MENLLLLLRKQTAKDDVKTFVQDFVRCQIIKKCSKHLKIKVHVILNCITDWRKIGTVTSLWLKKIDGCPFHHIFLHSSTNCEWWCWWSTRYDQSMFVCLCWKQTVYSETVCNSKLDLDECQLVFWLFIIYFWLGLEPRPAAFRRFKPKKTPESNEWYCKRNLNLVISHLGPADLLFYKHLLHT